jgi:hypothetical protein
MAFSALDPVVLGELVCDATVFIKCHSASCVFRDRLKVDLLFPVLLIVLPSIARPRPYHCVVLYIPVIYLL